ncbi:hypothetical protein BT93_F1080 [Corymbia citriodora subsp. variegata]|nr:hypothetical protein BT93_F1080 [Corymbia citriodora subsp. variegata]
MRTFWSHSRAVAFCFRCRSWRRSRMSSDRSLLPVPDRRVVLGCGSVSVDFLAAVASYPKPDDKIRSTSLKVQGSGNAGNALTCAAHLGLNPRLISKEYIGGAGGRRRRYFLFGALL